MIQPKLALESRIDTLKLDEHFLVISYFHFEKESERKEHPPLKHYYKPLTNMKRGTQKYFAESILL